MHPFDIKTKIAEAGTSQAAIAAYLKVRAASVGRVIRGEMRSQRIEVELSKIVGQPVFSAPRKVPGRPKTTWTGQVDAAAKAASTYNGVERRNLNRLADDRTPATNSPVSQPTA